MSLVSKADRMERPRSAAPVSAALVTGCRDGIKASGYHPGWKSLFRGTPLVILELLLAIDPRCARGQMRAVRPDQVSGRDGHATHRRRRSDQELETLPFIAGGRDCDCGLRVEDARLPRRTRRVSATVPTRQSAAAIGMRPSAARNVTSTSQLQCRVAMIIFLNVRATQDQDPASGRSSAGWISVPLRSV